MRTRSPRRCPPALNTDTARQIISLATEWGGNPTATALGIAERLPAPSAALVNGTLAHALDFDDTHVPSISHPSASAVAAALAAAEDVHASGRDLLVGIAIGNEITLRLGNAAYDPRIGNSVFFERGLHATSIAGALGSAAAAAVVMGLNSAQVAHAIGIAASMHCGWAAHAGVVAAQAARAGMTGPPTVLEGRFGFFQAYCGDTYDEQALLGDLGTVWQYGDCFVKPYPTNVFTHTGIDAAIALRAKGITPEEIESVEIGVPGPGMRTISQPREAKIRPESGYHAQFSGPFTFALALRGGSGLGVYLDDFTNEAVADPINQAVAERVTHVADPVCESLYPMQFASIVRVRLKDGRELVEEVLANRGTSGRPLSDAEIETKFRLNARVLGDQADELAHRIANVAELTDANDLLAGITTA